MAWVLKKYEIGNDGKYHCHREHFIIGFGTNIIHTGVMFLAITSIIEGDIYNKNHFKMVENERVVPQNYDPTSMMTFPISYCFLQYVSKNNLRQGTVDVENVLGVINMNYVIVAQWYE